MFTYEKEREFTQRQLLYMFYLTLTFVNLTKHFNVKQFSTYRLDSSKFTLVSPIDNLLAGKEIKLFIFVISP